MEEYVERHIDPEPSHLKRLYRRANLRLLYTRMMSGHAQGRLLKMLTAMIRPGRVLEIGAYAGYATLCLAEGLTEGAVVDTVEIDDELEPFLREAFDDSPYAEKINLHIGNALDVVPSLAAKGLGWEMALIDADKRLYPEYYRMLLRVMKPGSWILADNTLWNGKVALNGRSSDPQLQGILEFNDMVAADDRVEKVIIPMRDGLTLIHIKPNAQWLPE